MYRFAGEIWGQTERFLSAALLAFFLNFDLASAVVPIAPDLLMTLPHIAAIYAAWRGNAFRAGLWCGVAFLFNVKGAFVLATCAVLCWRNLAPLVAGVSLPNVAVMALLAATGALPDYFRQVWQWGAAYAANSPVADPIWNGFQRTVNWLGFHTALVIGAAAFWWRNKASDRRWIAAWCAISFAGVALGAQFRPRYFFELLPPLVLAASRGLALLLHELAPRRRALVWIAVILALLVPLVRFGPRYALLARDLVTGQPHQWSDVALDQDSQAAAAEVNALKRPGDTLFVWGYRPGIFVYTRLTAASQFWDSQPITGVPADRHLFDSRPILPDWAVRNRLALAASRPTFIVDSLTLSNPRLDLEGYPELRAWLNNYRALSRTRLSVIYRLKD
jgi:hypothetical protein